MAVTPKLPIECHDEVEWPVAVLALLEVRRFDLASWIKTGRDGRATFQREAGIPGLELDDRILVVRAMRIQARKCGLPIECLGHVGELPRFPLHDPGSGCCWCDSD